MGKGVQLISLLYSYVRTKAVRWGKCYYISFPAEPSLLPASFCFIFPPSPPPYLSLLPVGGNPTFSSALALKRNPRTYSTTPYTLPPAPLSSPLRPVLSARPPIVVLLPPPTLEKANLYKLGNFPSVCSAERRGEEEEHSPKQ